LAVKIIRQPKKIVLLGSATSAAALRGGHERAPAALRAAGLADRLRAAGFEVADQGDTATQVFQPDDEHPRARNVPAILKSLNDLRPRVEVAVKTGALPLIVSGDCISVLATVAGTRRYYRNVSLMYMDRDADLNLPATTPSGFIDGMVISHVIGRGAPELVRFWGEPPLVREPDIALFGFERLDPSEEQYLISSPLRRHSALEVSTAGAAAAARIALERVHGEARIRSSFRCRYHFEPRVSRDRFSRRRRAQFERSARRAPRFCGSAKPGCDRSGGVQPGTRSGWRGGPATDRFACRSTRSAARNRVE